MQTQSILFRKHQIKYLKPDQSIHSKYHQDIIPGKYQGGLKVWECQFDLLQYLDSSDFDFTGKKIIQIGCGHGLIGIASLLLGGKQVTFQDYNQDVLIQITNPTLNLNFKQEQRQKCKLVSGDWQTIQLQQKYDIVIGSELIYNENNYKKILNFIRKWMKDDGICILGNKHYYFGVGGNMPGFKDAIQEYGFFYKTLLKINPQKGGNKKEIIQVAFNQITLLK